MFFLSFLVWKVKSLGEKNLSIALYCLMAHSTLQRLAAAGPSGWCKDLAQFHAACPPVSITACCGMHGVGMGVKVCGWVPYIPVIPAHSFLAGNVGAIPSLFALLFPHRFVNAKGNILFSGKGGLKIFMKNASSQARARV